MANVVATSMEAEGSTPLKTLFQQHDKLKIVWYNKLIENDIDYDDLIQSEDQDLRGMLKEDCELKNTAVTRIINIIRDIPESRIYKNAHGVKVSIVSKEEDEAVLKIKKQSSKINDVMINITNITKTFDENIKSYENIINNKCDKMIDVINIRRSELLGDLKRISETKRLRQNTYHQSQIQYINNNTMIPMSTCASIKLMQSCSTLTSDSISSVVINNDIENVYQSGNIVLQKK
eukprot:152871_1